MDKVSFNSMETDNQVKVFNELLKGCSIRQVTEQIGIAKTTVRDRFKKAGYNYSADVNQYVKSCDAVGVILNNKNITTGNNKSKKVVSNNKGLSSNKNIDNVYSEILELLELKEESLIQKEKVKENITQELKINKFDSELKS